MVRPRIVLILRSGIEKSRNLMTVRLANDMGMKLVVEYAERFGVYDHLAPDLLGRRQWLEDRLCPVDPPPQRLAPRPVERPVDDDPVQPVTERPAPVRSYPACRRTDL